MPVITDLMKLQKIEIQLHSLEKRETDLKNDANIAALQELETATVALLAKGDRLMIQNETKTKELETKIAEYQMQIKQDDVLLYSGKIQNTRELEALQQQIAEERNRLEQTEEQQLELMDKREKYLRKIAKETKRLEECRNELKTAEELQRESLGEIAIERFEIEAQLEETAALIPADSLKQYRQLAASHRGIGIASLSGDVCGACHVVQSDETLKQIRRSGDKFVFCDNCGRIICNC